MKRTQYPIHSDFRKWQNMNPPLNSFIVPIIQKMMKLLWYQEHSSRDVKVFKHKIVGRDNQKIRIIEYLPINVNKQAPCIVYYHGGGFVLPAASHHFKLARIYAHRTQCKVFFVDYRLAPKYPFPNGLNDCYDSYQWVVKNASELGINPNKIIVAGDSAGGELAAVVCLIAKDENYIEPCGQMLIYPVTSRGIETESMKKYFDTPMCNSRDIEKYDKFYIKNDDIVKREYCSPIEAPSHCDLPPAYVETAEFDCLRDSGIMYANKLKDAGVPVELYNTEGTIHGYDIVLKSLIVQEAIKRRVRFLKSILNEKTTKG